MPNALSTLQKLPEHLLSAMHSFLEEACILAVTDVRGIIVFANEAFSQISGYSRDELIGQTHQILKSGVHTPEFYQQLWKTIAHGHTWRGEICNRAKNGSHYWVDSTISPIRDAAGKITHYVALRVDITEAKATQQRLLEEERLATVGRIADGVAHDMNNLLTGALGFTELATNMDPQHRSMLFQSLRRMAQLTQNLRDLAHDRPMQQRRFNLAHNVESTTQLASYKATRNTPLRVRVDCDQIRQCDVFANEGQILEIILNLVTNAVEAVSKQENGLITVTGRIEGTDAAIYVQDNGAGVDPAFLPQLFTPYASTKGRGRGKGLSASKHIAIAHNGDLVLAPTPIGACFKLTLPIVDKVSDPLRANATGNVVLIMEDQTVVAEAITSLLAAHGLKGIIIDSVEELIVRAGQLKDTLTAAVLDSEGSRNEHALVGLLREVRKNLPVVLTSASGRDRGFQETQHGPVYVLPKPFHPNQLIKVIVES